MARGGPYTKNIPVYGHPALGFKDGATKPFRYVRDNFFNAGLDTFTLPPAQDPDSFELLQNFLPSETGVLQPRWGTRVWASNASSHRYGGNIFLHQDYTNNRKFVIEIGGSDGAAALLENGTVFRTLPTLNANNVQVFSRGYSYFADGAGNDLKWDGLVASTLTKWGIVAPPDAPTYTAAAGAVTLVAGRTYFLIFKNSTTGHLSDLSPASLTTGPQTSQQFNFTGLDVSADGQVDKKIILATADGNDETTLYFVGEINNATTTFTDNTPETTLLTNQVYLSTDILDGTEHGVADNTPPPAAGILPIKHRGRLFMANGRTTYFSKSLDELTTSTGFTAGKYEEAWPTDHFFDISEDVETIAGYLSYGDILYMGTDKSIRRLAGATFADFTLGEPEMLFSDVGVANQYVWKKVFLEGSPIGAMWLTPDKRVIGSDFNTYRDIGTPIQDQLNQINSANLSTARAAYVSQGAYTFYLLAVNTSAVSLGASSTFPNIVFAYNIRTQKWATWSPTQLETTWAVIKDIAFYISSPNGGTAGGYTYKNFPTILISLASSLGNSSNDGATLQMDQSLTNDSWLGGSGFYSVIRTAWLDLGDPTLFKAINEVEVYISGNTAITVYIQGANNAPDFASPPFQFSGAPVLSPVFNVLKLYTAGQKTKYRYYKLTFEILSAVFSLDSFVLDVVPITRT